jgi:hypothetical protein
MASFFGSALWILSLLLTGCCYSVPQAPNTPSTVRYPPSTIHHPPTSQYSHTHAHTHTHTYHTTLHARKSRLRAQTARRRIDSVHYTLTMNIRECRYARALSGALARTAYENGRAVPNFRGVCTSPSGILPTGPDRRTGTQQRWRFGASLPQLKALPPLCCPSLEPPTFRAALWLSFS